MTCLMIMDGDHVNPLLRQGKQETKNAHEMKGQDMKRIQELEDAMDAAMDAIASGCYVIHYACTTRGDVQIMGRHVTVMIPRTGPLYGALKAALVRTFEEFYATPTKVGRTKITGTLVVGGITKTFSTFTIEY